MILDFELGVEPNFERRIFLLGKWAEKERKLNLASVESRTKTLHYWTKNGIFYRTMEEREWEREMTCHNFKFASI